MTHETDTRPAEAVLAIWNPTLTLKICLGATLTQERSTCEYLAPDDEDDGEEDDGEEPIGCDERVATYPGPIVVSGDGVAHFCEACVAAIDYDFVARYDEAFSLMVDEDLEAGGPSLCIEDMMDRLVVHFPPSDGYIIERGPDPFPDGYDPDL